MDKCLYIHWSRFCAWIAKPFHIWLLDLKLCALRSKMVIFVSILFLRSRCLIYCLLANTAIFKPTFQSLLINVTHSWQASQKKTTHTHMSNIYNFPTAQMIGAIAQLMYRLSVRIFITLIWHVSSTALHFATERNRRAAIY